MIIVIDNSAYSSASKLRKVNNYQLHFHGGTAISVHRVFRALLLPTAELAEAVDVDVEVALGVLILNRNQPVASHISRHTVELYQNRSKVTKSCNFFQKTKWFWDVNRHELFGLTKLIHNSLDSENFVPKYWLTNRIKGAKNTLSKVSNSLLVIWATWNRQKSKS